MTPERWRAVDRVVQGALDRAPAERPAFVDAACAGDAALRAEVTSLLAAADAGATTGRGIVDRPAAAALGAAFGPAFGADLGADVGGASTDDDEAAGGDAAGTPTRLALLAAALADRYVLEREVGRGGMSVVYRGRDERHARVVALKVLRPGLSAALGRARFQREITTAAGLQHPHIVPVLDSGEMQGALWFAMPYVEGESLRHRLRREDRLPVADAVRIARAVALALDYAHRRGVVHRDVKPENILLSDGQALVADFGIATVLNAAAGPGTAASPTHTGAEGSLGTPAYMAPEQAAGEAVDARTDVYALGLVCYEMLAGRHPFAEATTAPELLAAHLNAPPPPLRGVAAAVPAPLAGLVMRCLAKDPAQRPGTAAELVAALDALLDASLDARLDAASRADGVPTRALPSTRRRRAAPALAGLAALTLGAALAWRAHAGAAARVRGSDAALPLVAVLPFESTGGSADGVAPDRDFADGLGDAITAKLARLAGLRVIDRASVQSVPDAAAHPEAAGRTLGADYVLRATLRWARGADGRRRVQVSPVLVRVADGTTRWAGEPEVVMPADPFTVQGTLATEVAEALDVALAPAERAGLAARATRDTAAFAAVERGRRRLRDATLSMAEGRARALREFEFAYRRDPQDTEAWGGAADVLLYQGDVADSVALVDSAAVLARRALALDPGNVDAVNALLGDAYAHGRFAAATAVVARAVRTRPSSAELRMLSANERYQAGDTAAAWPAVLEAL
ncbi:hypothetical protein tb265_05770 [Gemmatimonadetes bacterium T265]|nr:hypothetical protein tb265_05770 [Gemmatimonadetes bacterium T265]